MKKYLLLSALAFVMVRMHAQSHENKVIDFKMEARGQDTINVSGYRMFEDGHGELVKVFFEGWKIPKDKWREMAVKNNKGSDEGWFETLTWIFSYDAQNQLKNRESFVPLRKQFFMWSDEGSYLCSYKLMGRNGYGNLIELEALVEYNPDKK
jgi:hypothetical protein